ncbi:MAG TPA: adenylosuccinate synthetase [Candidatus Saccharimonadales bacterium]|nr:adenylosuccinate synthetase [Candidatus Saccharimonadales bacterium]
MAVDVIVGLQRGDEGKGRFVDMLAAEHDIVARFNGGPNAGHTVVLPEGKELKLHGIPSGIGYPGKLNVIGDGEFIDAVKLCAEIDYLEVKDVPVSPDNLLISSSSHLILPHHIVQDMRRESGEQGQGSTKAGIAYVDADFALREGARAEIINNDPDELAKKIIQGLYDMGRLTSGEQKALGADTKTDITDKYVEDASKLGPFVTDTMLFLNNALDQDQSILAEGAQAFLLDKYQGMWPNVTSSITTSGGVSPGLGVAPHHIDKVIGVFKAIHSHVGGGHFVTEIDDKEQLNQLHGNPDAGDAERGTTTGRLRRLGHLDIPVLRRANIANGTTELAVTKLDWLSRYGETILVCTGYKRKGKNLTTAPNAEYKLMQSEPIYEEISGWDENISEMRDFRELPSNARDYVHILEDKLEVPITRIGVGPRRDQVIIRGAA